MKLAWSPCTDPSGPEDQWKSGCTIAKLLMPQRSGKFRLQPVPCRREVVLNNGFGFKLRRQQILLPSWEAPGWKDKNVEDNNSFVILAAVCAKKRQCRVRVGVRRVGSIAAQKEHVCLCADPTCSLSFRLKNISQLHFGSRLINFHTWSFQIHLVNYGSITQMFQKFSKNFVKF